MSPSRSGSFLTLTSVRDNEFADEYDPTPEEVAAALEAVVARVNAMLTPEEKAIRLEFICGMVELKEYLMRH